MASSFSLKPSQFILLPISTNLSLSFLIRSYSLRMAKSVKLFMPHYILLIIFIVLDLIDFFGILRRVIVRIVTRNLAKNYKRSFAVYFAV